MHVPDDVWCHIGALRMICDTNMRREYAVRRIQSRWKKTHPAVGKRCELIGGRTGLIVHNQDHRVMVRLDKHRKSTYLFITKAGIRGLHLAGEEVRETVWP